MQYHIDTIPIWDAVKENSECPLCLLYDQLEQKFVAFYLGDSVMESDVRIEVNKKGFCAHHYKMMFDQGERLPLALMAYTRLGEKINDIAPQLEMLIHQNVPRKKDAITPLTRRLDEKHQPCAICERIEKHMERYYTTVIHMVKKESEFKKALFTSRGLCLHHFSKLLTSANKHLHGGKKREFIAGLCKLQQENLQRLSAEIKWFADKFDHKNANKDWGTSRDALPRILNKLGGKKL